MLAFLGEQNLVSIKLQLIVALREIVGIYDVTAGVCDRHGNRGFVLVHAVPRCSDAARSLTPFSAKGAMQRNNFFSRAHCPSSSITVRNVAAHIPPMVACFITKAEHTRGIRFTSHDEEEDLILKSLQSRYGSVISTNHCSGN